MKKIKADNPINEIQVSIFSLSDGFGEMSIEDLEKISSILALIKLMEERAELCELFVDSPGLERFTLKLYLGKKLLKTFRIAGPFFIRDGEYYWTGDVSLVEILKDYTKDAHLKKPVWKGSAWA